MSQSFTQKRRPRYSFAKNPFDFPIPNLLELQLNAYHRFLQEDILPSKRKNFGLQGALNSIFPIVSSSGLLSLEFVSYRLTEPEYSVRSCKLRGLTYSAPLYVKFRFVVYAEKPSENSKPSILNINEQEVFFGSIPLMTEDGQFVINGTERVVVSQLHRSPGIIFDHDKGRTHASGKLLFSARIIPYRGSWLDFEFDHNDLLNVRIDRKRKILATTFFKALDMDVREILEAFYSSCPVHLEDNYAVFKEWFNELANKELTEDLVLNDKVLGKKGERLTKPNNLKDLKNIRFPCSILVSHILAVSVVDQKTGEIIFPENHQLTESDLETLKEQKIKTIHVIKVDRSKQGLYISDTLRAENTASCAAARLEIYKIIRPGEPSSEQAVDKLFESLFFHNERYDLSEIGRMKINHQFQIKGNEGPLYLEKIDMIRVTQKLMNIRDGIETWDDVDSLTNRRIRGVDEMLENQIRITLVRLEKNIKDRLSISEEDALTPKDLFNSRPLSSIMKDFFGTNQLSQFMDQINPLSGLTHKRRISALGPNGLTRERAGFEVRDVHTTHYGRLCPIETPEGPNIGLINTMSIYAKVNHFGFLETPLYKVKKGRVLVDQHHYVSAISEYNLVIAQANVRMDKDGKILDDLITCRHKNEFTVASPEDLDYIDVSARQIVSVAASLIPFLENDDANRALMGSNMQRQAVSTLIAEAPLVGTGMESTVISHSQSSIVAKHSGRVSHADSSMIMVTQEDKIKLFDYSNTDENALIDVYLLKKYERSNQNTCINQMPIVKIGDWVSEGDVIADGSSVDNGELALGKNLLVAFMSWNGYNFEDSIFISDRLYREDVLTSIHIEEVTGYTRDTRLGPEEVTADVPGVGEKSLSKLDEIGIVYIGANVEKGDILIGKITPKGDSFVTPEEKLLHAIFGEKALNVKDTSIYATYSGCVIDAQVFSHSKLNKPVYEQLNKELLSIKKELESEFHLYRRILVDLLFEKANKVKASFQSPKTDEVVHQEYLATCPLKQLAKIKCDKKVIVAELNKMATFLLQKDQEKNARLDAIQNRLKTSDQLPPGVLEMVKIYIAVKRKIQPGDKMAGRHGNKGVVSQIAPVEDMPYLEDGTPVDIVLNPLGVPSRMNVGQILETHLGWAAKKLGQKLGEMLDKKDSVQDIKSFIDKIFATSSQKITWDEYQDDDVLAMAENLRNGVPMATPVFDGAKEDEIKAMLRLAGLPENGQTYLYDGLTGERFERPITVGYIYMLKLNHLVDDKMHARSTGPYSLVTQQPLGGKAQQGGQRLGEMEVWALEAYGAAYILQEMLTIKSDDSYGRTKLYKDIIDNVTFTEPKIPESFKVLIKELNALGLDLVLE